MQENKSVIADLVLPSCAFGPILWYERALSSSNFIIDIWENYPKQTYRNRFDILTSHGRSALTLPVQGQKGVKTPTKDIRLSEGNWRKQHLASLMSSYRKAAFYEHLEGDLFDLFSDQRVSFLLDFNRRAFEIIQPFIKPLSWNESTCFIMSTEVSRDLRSSWEPIHSTLSLPSYPQVFGDRIPFQSQLSVIDLVMNIGPAALNYVLLLKNDSAIVSAMP